MESIDARILVLGSGSFVGAHLKDELQAQGRRVFEVRGRLDADLANFAVCARVVREVQPNVVYHLACAADRKASLVRSRRQVENSLRCTFNLIRALKRYAPACLVIHLGSYKQYGARPIPFRESELPLPRGAYGIAKQISEWLLRHTRRTIDSICLRSGPMYGPGQSGILLIPYTIRALQTKSNAPLYASDVEWDPMYIDDGIAALSRCLHSPQALGQVLNISGGQAHSPYEIMCRVEQILNVSRGRVQKEPHFPGAYRCLGDITRAQRLLDWTPRVGLDRGLEKTIQAAIYR